MVGFSLDSQNGDMDIFELFGERQELRGGCKRSDCGARIAAQHVQNEG